MATGQHWTDREIALTVADYMKMLTLELAGQSYNKTTHRRALLEQLDGRSNGAVELKHQNISAVLRDLNCFWIPGYKPRANYQEALARYLEAWINTHPEFDRASQFAVEQPAFMPSGIELSKLLVDAPTPSNEVKENHPAYAVKRSPSKRDYVAQEARNSALGSAGEFLVMEYEEFRLRSAGKKALADRIEHVSQSQGDGLGYDILSYEISGKERFLEVKTTAFAKETPFYASRNEVLFSEEFQEQFHLYRLFEFRKSPKLFSLPGAIGNHCFMDPVSFVCKLR
ncbi:DUF3883 domain-containing protein [Marinobacter sp. M-5]|jgi:hypothetical protein|uniref:DUF3883 domain-containing protein n=1 Tax=Marinobacter sp. M-5 TaxID=3081089 RepID=UPI00293D1C57|nr:DUF3883 domain-containing protein [Marinobacter sp. M-5]MDV3503274.1 DUF3883 domain-containing protein [Marinobacter sp. M-5]